MLTLENYMQNLKSYHSYAVLYAWIDLKEIWDLKDSSKYLLSI